jgi:hypothetical protein
MDEHDQQNSEATDDDVKRVDDAGDSVDSEPGGSVEQGVGGGPTNPTDPDENEDPKSGHSPVGQSPV